MAELIPSARKTQKGKLGRVLRISAICLVLIMIAVFIAIPPLIMKDMIHMHAEVKEYSAAESGITAQELSLTTEDGVRLISWMVEAEQPRGTVLFLSGIHNPSVTAFYGHAKMLSEQGFSSLLIEMRSHGRSEGSNKIYLGMKEYMDTRAGVEYLLGRQEYAGLPMIVFGVSMGGATAINSIGKIPEIDGVISASAFSSWPDVFCDNMAGMGAPAFFTALQKPFVWLYMGFEFGFGNLDINPIKEIKKLNGRPLLLMHSRGDTQVPFKSYERLLKEASENTATYVTDGDHHFVCRENFLEPWMDKEYAGAVLDFLNKNFP